MVHFLFASSACSYHRAGSAHNDFSLVFQDKVRGAGGSWEEWFVLHTRNTISRTR